MCITILSCAHPLHLQQACRFHVSSLGHCFCAKLLPSCRCHARNATAMRQMIGAVRIAIGCAPDHHLADWLPTTQLSAMARTRWTGSAKTLKNFSKLLEDLQKLIILMFAREKSHGAVHHCSIGRLSCEPSSSQQQPCMMCSSFAHDAQAIAAARLVCHSYRRIICHCAKRPLQPLAPPTGGQLAAFPAVRILICCGHGSPAMCRRQHSSGLQALVHMAAGLEQIGCSCTALVDLS